MRQSLRRDQLYDIGLTSEAELMGIAESQSLLQRIAGKATDVD